MSIILLIKKIAKIIDWHLISRLRELYKPVVKYKFNNLNLNANNIIIYSHFNKNNIIDDYVLKAIDDLCLDFNCEFIFVTTSKYLSNKQLLFNNPRFLGYVHKKNIGLDFHAWKTALNLYNKTFKISLNQINTLILTNDSCFGPFHNFSHLIIPKIKSDQSQLFGITECYEFSRHIQSYFLFFNKTLLNEDYLTNFFNKIRPLKSKTEIIVKYEVGLSKIILINGGEIIPLIKTFDIRYGKATLRTEPDIVTIGLNPTIHFWDTLIAIGSPFMKKSIILSQTTSRIAQRNFLWIPHVLKLNYRMKNLLKFIATH